MSRYALLFSKTGYIKYTSHLDMMRLFKRAMRRADIKISYSQGFNPHPRMSFCQPLSLGYSANNEILEFRTDSDEGRDSWVNELMKCLPKGIALKGLALLKDSKRSLASTVYACDYTIFIHGFVPEEAPDAFLRGFTSQDEIMAAKKTKKGDIKDIDIKPFIRSISIIPRDDLTLIETTLDSGSDSNLSPELLIQALASYSGGAFKRSKVDVIRENIHLDIDYDLEWL